jgi:serine/threonine protein kinase
MPAQREESPPPAPEPAPPPILVPPSLPPTTNKRRPTLEYRPGEEFAGRYRIVKLIGKGGMGAVYLAEQRTLARNVAIKLLHGTADPMTTARFQREARVIAQLQHPHIVNLIDFGDADGQLYLVMEFIDGEPLSRLVKREGALATVRVLDLAIQMAEALAVAHGMGVIHRDIKPDNLMVMKTSTGKEFLKILDFGVAKINREANDNNTIQTQAGMIVGSLRYIAPEQLESKDVTARTDMYAFGCVLYEMLTGRRVFEYQSPADCALAHLSERPKPPQVDGRPLTGPLVDIVMLCLEKDPAARPADAREALQRLIDARRAEQQQQRQQSHSPPDAPRVSARHATGLKHLGGSGITRASSPDADGVMTLQGGDMDPSLAAALASRKPSHPRVAASEPPEDPTRSPTSPSGSLRAPSSDLQLRMRPEPGRRGGNEVLIDGIVGPLASPQAPSAPSAGVALRTRSRTRDRDEGGVPVWVWILGAVLVVAFGIALGFFLSRQAPAGQPSSPPAAAAPAASPAPTPDGTSP